MLRKKLIEFYLDHNPSKVLGVDKVVQHATQHGIPEEVLFEELRSHYPKSLRERLTEFYEKRSPDKLKDIDAILERARHDRVSDTALMSDLELKYAMSRRRSSQQATTVSPSPEPCRETIVVADTHNNKPLVPSPSPAPVRPSAGSTTTTTTAATPSVDRNPSTASASRLRAKTTVSAPAPAAVAQPVLRQSSLHAVDRDESERVMREELRSWMCDVMEKDEATLAVLKEHPDNVVENLRNGAVLTVLMKTLQGKPAALKGVKSNMFFARELVAQFIAACKSEFGMSDVELFVPNDLVESKNDSLVVSSLLSLARKAGLARKAPLPRMLRYEMEIEEQQKQLEPLDDNDLDEVILQSLFDEEAVIRSEIVDERRDTQHKLGEQLAFYLQESQRREDIVKAERDMWTMLQGVDTNLGVASEEATNRREIMELESMAAGLLWEMCSRLLAQHHAWQQEERRERERRAREAALQDSRVKALRRARDEVDIAAAQVIRQTDTSWRLTAINQPGQFVLWRPDRQKEKMVLFLRVLQGVVMIRVGGGWEDFRGFLRRKDVEWDGVKYMNRLNSHEQNQQPQQKQKAGSTGSTQQTTQATRPTTTTTQQQQQTHARTRASTLMPSVGTTRPPSRSIIGKK